MPDNIVSIYNSGTYEYPQKDNCFRPDSLFPETPFSEISKFDVIVNCILWDVERKDHIIYREDLKRMKKNAMIIDVSCDRNGGIETSLPTTIFNPTYMVDGILHYAVDHTPAIYYKTFSYENSKIIQPFIEQLITGKHSEILENSLIIKRGIILDNMIVIPE